MPFHTVLTSSEYSSSALVKKSRSSRSSISPEIMDSISSYFSRSMDGFLIGMGSRGGRDIGSVATEDATVAGGGALVVNVWLRFRGRGAMPGGDCTEGPVPARARGDSCVECAGVVSIDGGGGGRGSSIMTAGGGGSSSASGCVLTTDDGGGGGG